MKAFPIVIDRETQIANDTNHAVQEEGMDLRDYFAAKAMAAIIMKADNYSTSIEEVVEWIGDYSYAVADAMMEARKK